MSSPEALIRWLREPEYTGENRCTPCTVANLVIAALTALAIGLVVPELGVIVFLISLLVIYFRGYLIPGTPAITARLLPDRVHQLFGTDAGPRETTQTGSWDAIDRHKQRKETKVEPEEYLLNAGILERVDGAEFKFKESFRMRARTEIESLSDHSLWHETAPTTDGISQIADLLGVSDDEVHPKEESYPSVRVSARVRQWPSEQALRVDIATHQALETVAEDWREVPLEQRLKILTALRSYQETCPCGGELSETTQTVDSCCRSGNVVALICNSCSDPLVERDPSSTDWFSVEDI